VHTITEAGEVEAHRLDDSVGVTFLEEFSDSPVRIDDAVYAIGDKCSHADVSLSEGEVLCDTKELECFKHGSAFSLVNGMPNTLPATQAVPVYAATVVDGNVMITVESAQ
jgi:3-phenylpropionate/trans-cinnamate dioxygenase ferredoxin subunit